MTKTRPMSVAEIVKISLFIRESMNVKINDAFPIFDYIDSLVEHKTLSLQVVDNDDYTMVDEHVVACYNALDNFIYVREQVLEDLDNDNYRSCFTLAHELFHFIQIQLLGFEFREVYECLPYEDAEWQANEFAGQLLIPEAFVDQPYQYLASHFKVSEECALTRQAKCKKRKMKEKEKELVKKS